MRAEQDHRAESMGQDVGQPSSSPLGGAADIRTTRNEGAIEIVVLTKWYGALHVLRDVSLQVKRGERIVICGPSGGGKSTLLRCINRIETWQKGRLIGAGGERTA